MAISVKYSLETMREKFIANGFETESQFGSTVLALPGGGYAVAYGNDLATGATPHVSFFKADGTPVDGPNGSFSIPYKDDDTDTDVQMIGKPSLSLMPNGNVLVTWLQEDPVWSTELYSAVLNPANGSTVVPQTLISNYDISEFSGMGLSNGNQVYTLTSFPSVYLAFKNPYGDHIGAYSLGDFPGFPVNATVTELKNGDLFVTYRQTQAGFASSVGTYYQYWNPAGGALVAAILLTQQVIGTPAVAATAAGGSVMVYSVASLDGDGFMLSIIPPASATNPAVRSLWIEGEVDVMLSEPDVTVLENGFILVTWTSQGVTGGSDVMARLFTGSGAAVNMNGSTDAFVLAGGTASEWGSSVSALLAGQFITSWTEDSLDADGSGIGAVVKELVRTVVADADDNVIGGSTLKDIIYGLDGNDTLTGGRGNDQLYGGDGDDVYYSDGRDTIVEYANEGTDHVFSTRSITLADNIENLTLTGSASASGTGNALANVITGNDGNNHLSGGIDNRVDQLNGGLGNDTYDLGASRMDQVTDSGGSADTITSSVTRNLAYFADIENLTLTGTSAINGYGNAAANIIIGNDANNRLSGGADTASDILRGGLGNDTYLLGASTNDLVKDSGGSADEIVSSISRNLTNFAAIENLTLTGKSAASGVGNARANVIVGNSGNNFISGGLGADTLDGGAGADVLVGGRGADSFVFSDTLDALTNVDYIADFSAGDQIMLDGNVFNMTPLDFQAEWFMAVGHGTTLSSLSAIGKVVHVVQSGELYFGEATGELTLFARVDAGTQLTFEDFSFLN